MLEIYQGTIVMKQNNIFDIIFTKFYDIFFKKIGHNVPIGPIKNIMDPFYAIVEKIACQFPIIQSLYIKPYRSMIKQELSMFSFPTNSHVLVIGCGSLPATALALDELYPVTIDCVDIDTDAVNNAKSVLSTMKKENITVHQKNGLDCSIDTYDIVYLLYGIQDQITMLKHISKNLKNTSYVLFRTSTDIKETNKELYGTIHALFTVKNTIEIESFGSIETYLLGLKN